MVVLEDGGRQINTLFVHNNDDSVITLKHLNTQGSESWLFQYGLTG